eukprot:TRINITY_DN26299_c0_g1_i1.p1 TRINITY_DN26299_c0_g1~~TRINITY_DN26299_c0_g1_i1.p1  ORF type:complete len:841 (-),score=83.08 TRINITY_DN26299_c0_g1_i1:210-2732(-)
MLRCVSHVTMSQLRDVLTNRGTIPASAPPKLVACANPLVCKSGHAASIDIFLSKAVALLPAISRHRFLGIISVNSDSGKTSRHSSLQKNRGCHSFLKTSWFSKRYAYCFLRPFADTSLTFCPTVVRMSPTPSCVSNPSACIQSHHATWPCDIKAPNRVIARSFDDHVTRSTFQCASHLCSFPDSTQSASRTGLECHDVNAEPSASPAFSEPCQSGSHQQGEILEKLRHDGSQSDAATYVSKRREQLETYVKGWTPWIGGTPALVRQLAEEGIEFEERIREEMGIVEMDDEKKDWLADEEEKQFRKMYATMADSEGRLRAFSARQMANRMLGCLGYLCATCWLPQEDCLCEAMQQLREERGKSLDAVKFWLYMHPKEYLRKNNTGKLLLQSLGDKAAGLCICGIVEQERAMWQALREAGRESVFCLYPARASGEVCSVADIRIPVRRRKTEDGFREAGVGQADREEAGQEENAKYQRRPEEVVTDPDRRTPNGGESATEASGVVHFILIDGTWSNSRAMVSRLMDDAREAWGGREMACLALESEGRPSAMHHLRPQPSEERTCTAAAASSLLRQLHYHQSCDNTNQGPTPSSPVSQPSSSSEPDDVLDGLGTLLFDGMENWAKVRPSSPRASERAEVPTTDEQPEAPLTSIDFPSKPNVKEEQQQTVLLERVDETCMPNVAESPVPPTSQRASVETLLCDASEEVGVEERMEERAMNLSDVSTSPSKTMKALQIDTVLCEGHDESEDTFLPTNGRIRTTDDERIRGDDVDKGGSDLLHASVTLDRALLLLMKALSSRRVRSGRTRLRLGVGKNKGFALDRRRPSSSKDIPSTPTPPTSPES